MNKRHNFIVRATVVANIGLALGSALAAVIFVYFVYHYGWARDREFSTWYYAILYYGLPLSVAILLLLSLTLPPHQKLGLLIFLVVSTASVYGSELLIESMPSSPFASALPVMTVLARSHDKHRDAAALKNQWNVDIDTRSAEQFIAALRTRSIDAVPIIAPANQLLIDEPNGKVISAINIDGKELVPLAAVSNRPTVFCNEGGQWMYYGSDEHGFNNANEVWRRERLDIAALGDSFVHGYCVPPEQNFIALIRQRHAATLNLGIAGNGPLLMLATLREYLPRFAPRTVLWFYYEGNDLINLQRERKNTLLMNYMKAGFRQPALIRQDLVDRAILDEIPRLRALEATLSKAREENAAAGALGRLMRLSLLRERLGLIGGMNDDEGDEVDFQGRNMETFRDVLLDAKMEVENWGGKLQFVYLPEWARYTRYASLGKSARSDVLSLVQRLAIPIIDIEPAFEAYGDPLALFPFRGQGHYNEIGHRLVAQAVLRGLSYAN